MTRLSTCILLSCLGYCPLASGQGGIGSILAQKPQLAENYGKLPLSFEANTGLSFLLLDSGHVAAVIPIPPGLGAGDIALVATGLSRPEVFPMDHEFRIRPRAQFV